MSPLLNIVVLNDTRHEYHHGCSRVMNAIDYYLKKKANQITYFPVGKDWQKNESIKKSIILADIVIVNGEGTIHHNSPLGFSLVKVAKFAASYGVESFLINTTFQANSENYKEYLEYFNQIFVRESYSQKELNKLGIASVIVPDLTFSYRAQKKESAAHENILITCSVNKEVTNNLINTFSGSEPTAFTSIFNDNDTEISIQPPPFKGRLKQIFKNNSIKELFLKVIDKLDLNTQEPHIKWKVQTTHTDYSDFLEGAKIVICGRFHAMTLCINHDVPFLAIESNSHKVSGTLTDIGLDRARYLVKSDDFSWEKVNSFSVTEEEKYKMKIYSEQAKKSIQEMFTSILK